MGPAMGSSARREGKPAPASARPASQVRIEGEPDLASGTLDEWQNYRRALSALPPNDENVRIAIAVAEAQIARLR
jgi:hypothetical protein